MERDSEMSKKTLHKLSIQSGALLRKKAEERLTKQASIKAAHPISQRAIKNQKESENLRLLQELQIHQIELEIQNEELKLAVETATTATALYDFSPTGYFTIKQDGTICQLNQSGALLLNKKPNQLINSNLRLFISQDSLLVMNDFLKKIFESKSKQYCEVSLDLNQNLDKHVYLEGIISEDLQKCFITAIDITERQKAQAAIQESEERYRKLVELSPFGIAIYQEAKFVYVNRAGIALLGSSNTQDLIGKPVTSIVHPDSFPEVMRRMGLVANGNTVPPMEEKLIRIDGSIFIAEVIALSTTYNGKPAGQVIVSDITERKKAEDSLKLSEIRLSELNSSKDRFFSIIAHDLKGHFNSIIGFSSFLSENMKEKDYDGVEKYANIIQKSSELAMDLLINLMNWAQSQTGRMEFIPEIIDTTELIDEVVDFFSDAAQQKSISISRKCQYTDTIFADKSMISTILRNLISNALKYTLPGGKIVIFTEQKNNELMVTVKDNGIGIKRDAIEKLFSIEDSYSTIGTNNEVGTGFGLILCKEFVEKHNGKIWVESDPDGYRGGKGSKFCFTIPNSKQISQKT